MMKNASATTTGLGARRASPTRSQGFCARRCLGAATAAFGQAGQRRRKCRRHAREVQQDARRPAHPGRHGRRLVSLLRPAAGIDGAAAQHDDPAVQLLRRRRARHRRGKHERRDARARSDEARESGTRGKGQQVVADYLLKPEIVMANKDNAGGESGRRRPRQPVRQGRRGARQPEREVERGRRRADRWSTSAPPSARCRRGLLEEHRASASAASASAAAARSRAAPTPPPTKASSPVPPSSTPTTSSSSRCASTRPRPSRAGWAKAAALGVQGGTTAASKKVGK